MTLPPLNALRAFEAAGRHLSLTKAANELNVTPGAISHQIRGLEEFLNTKLFERRVRSIALTAQGKLLLPGLQTGFGQIRDAVLELNRPDSEAILVISTSPGITAKWLAPRLYRFSVSHPDIDARVSSGIVNADFVTDGVDVAIRNMPRDHPRDPKLATEWLFDHAFMTVCSPQVAERFDLARGLAALNDVPLIHDETFSASTRMPGWKEWLDAAAAPDVDLSRGLRFNIADHALEAAVEGAGLLLTHAVLAYDDIRTGRLVRPFPLTLESHRAYYLVWPRSSGSRPKVAAFRDWIRQEVEQLDSEILGLSP